jgi:hypothetical protein
VRVGRCARWPAPAFGAPNHPYSSRLAWSVTQIRYYVALALTFYELIRLHHPGK